MGIVDELEDFDIVPDIKPRKRLSAKTIRRGMEFAEKMRLKALANRQSGGWKQELKTYHAAKATWEKRNGGADRGANISDDAAIVRNRHPATVGDDGGVGISEAKEAGRKARRGASSRRKPPD